MNTPRVAGRCRPSGFTLVELMVGMGITAVIFTVLISITSSATDTWTRGRSEVRAARQAKVAVDMMARDLSSLVMSQGNGFEWLNFSQDKPTNSPEFLENTGKGMVSKLTFMTVSTDRYYGDYFQEGANNVMEPIAGKRGDVSCVGYRLDYGDPIRASAGASSPTNTMILYRRLVDPDQTYGAGGSQPLLGIDGEVGMPSNLESEFDKIPASAGDQEDFLSENIQQFTLVFHVEAINSITNIPEIKRVMLAPDSTVAYFRVTGNGLDMNEVYVDGAAAQNIAELKTGILKAIEINMTVLSNAGMTRIASSGTGLSEKDYARNSYNYSRVVPVPGF